MRDAADNPLLKPRRGISRGTLLLQAKVGALQRPVVPVVKKPPSVAPRKPPAVPRPDAANPETDQPEPAPGAPTRQ